MSLELLNKAWSLDLSTTQKIVLVSICCQANEKGICFPSVQFIAKRCSLSTRAVFRSLEYLKGVGLVKVRSRLGRSSLYKVNGVLLTEMALACMPEREEFDDDFDDDDIGAFGGATVSKGHAPKSYITYTNHNLNIKDKTNVLSKDKTTRVDAIPIGKKHTRGVDADPISGDPCAKREKTAPTRHDGPKDDIPMPNDQTLPVRPKKGGNDAKGLRAMPPDFAPDQVGRECAQKFNIDLGLELDRFKNYNDATGRKMKNWQAAWRLWCSKAGSNTKKHSYFAAKNKKSSHDLSGIDYTTGINADGTF